MAFKKPLYLLFFLFFINVDSFAESPISIQGDWEFYWKQFYSSNNFQSMKIAPDNMVQIPSSWTTYTNNTNESYPSEGYATYRKIISLKDYGDISNLGIKIPQIWTASKVFINGKLVSQKGVINDEGEQLVAEMYIDIIDLSQFHGGNLEIIVHVANQEFFLSGFISNFQIGNLQSIITHHQIINALFLLLFGGLILMSLYHYILYFFRKKSKATLYFATLVFLMLIHTIVFGEHFVYEYLHFNLGMNVKLQSTIYYVTIFLMVLAALWYVRSLYPSEAKFLIVNYYSILILFICVLISVLPNKVIFPYIEILFIPSVIGLIYILYVLALSIIRKRKFYILQILSISFLFFAGVNDVLFLINVKITGIADSLIFGFVLFLIVQMIIIAKDFSSTYETVEELTYNLERKVLQRTAKLNEQRKELAFRNERIQESIDYASKIQHAMLPTVELLKEKFNESFIFYQPKDVLSGDFYFIDEVDYHDSLCTVIVVADCTGHGIPGAMMSMMGNTIIKRILQREKNISPGDVLTRLDENIQEVLKQDETNNHDGMDISIVYIDKSNKKVYYASANSYIAFIKENELITIRGDKLGVGGVKDEKIQFNTKTITWYEKIQIYQFSDGFQDQFGGKKGKKFQRGKFHQLLKEISTLNVEKQNEAIVNNFNFWKGDYEQVDDVLVIGVKLS